MKITSKEIKQLIKEETAKVLEAYELSDVPIEGPPSDDETRMDKVAGVFEELWANELEEIMTGASVTLPTGEVEPLDYWFSMMGNMVVSGGIGDKEVMRMIKELADGARQGIERASREFVDEDHIEDQKWERGEYDHLVDRDELEEKKLTDAEKDKKEEIAQAIEKDNPKMPMGKKMAIATAQAKKSA